MSWMITNLEEFNDKIAIIHKGISYTYKQLFDNIESIKSNVIKDKINQGEVVSILDDYSFNSISLLLALYQNKNIVVPITTNITNEIFVYCEKANITNDILALTRTKLIFHWLYLLFHCQNNISLYQTNKTNKTNSFGT